MDPAHTPFRDPRTPGTTARRASSRAASARGASARGASARGASTRHAPPHPDADILASEARQYAFCALSWHRRYVQGLPPDREAHARLAAGRAAHEAHGAAIARQHTIARVAQRLAVIAALLACALAAAALLAR